MVGSWPLLTLFCPIMYPRAQSNRTKGSWTRPSQAEPRWPSSLSGHLLCGQKTEEYTNWRETLFKWQGSSVRGVFSKTRHNDIYSGLSAFALNTKHRSHDFCRDQNRNKRWKRACRELGNKTQLATIPTLAFGLHGAGSGARNTVKGKKLVSQLGHGAHAMFGSVGSDC